MAAVLRELAQGEGPFILVLSEREQNMQQIPIDEQGMPAQSEETVARVEFVITEGLARVTAQSLRETSECCGLFECRVQSAHPHEGEVTMLHYLYAGDVVRVATRAHLSL